MVTLEEPAVIGPLIITMSALFLMSVALSAS